MLFLGDGIWVFGISGSSVVLKFMPISHTVLSWIHPTCKDCLHSTLYATLSHDIQACDIAHAAAGCSAASSPDTLPPGQTHTLAPAAHWRLLFLSVAVQDAVHLHCSSPLGSVTLAPTGLQGTRRCTCSTAQAQHGTAMEAPTDQDCRML